MPEEKRPATRTTSLFLTEEELVILTGRKLRRLQIKALRGMMIPFHVNAIGHPVVTREAVTGENRHQAVPASKWTPRVVGQ